MQEGFPGYDPGAQPYDAQVSGPRKSSSTGCIVAVIAGAAAVALLVCCGGGGALVWFGLDVMSAEVEQQLRDQPRVREHFGELRSVKMDFAKSAAVEGDDVFVYQVEGTKGSGEVTVRLEEVEFGEQRVTEATLRLSSGEEIDLLAE
jgi:hypothetical protein